MKQFCMGDIHGAFKALLQCLERSNFDYEKDELIVLGDVCDGWPYVYECIEELMKIKNLIYVIGNHDRWALNWAKYDTKEYMWIEQGGLATISSYNNHGYDIMPGSHRDFLLNGNLWFEDDNTLYVHGGINPLIDIGKQTTSQFLWDRDLIQIAYQGRDKNISFSPYKEVFVGHTTTLYKPIFGDLAGTKPLHFCNIWNLDTGAGWSGKLTIMNTKTNAYWQSDLVKELYPNIQGRS